MCLRVKDGVKFSPIAPGGFRILSALEQASAAIDKDLTITCGSDSHPPTDRHTLGEAYDVRVSDLTARELALLLSYLRHTLGDEFTVLYEVPQLPNDGVLAALVNYVNKGASAPHVHVQVKKGATYPVTV